MNCRAVTLVIVIALAVCAASAGVSGGSPPIDAVSAGHAAASDAGVTDADNPRVPSADSSAGIAQDGSFDRSTVRITIAADGSATWTFRYERTLESDAERDDFEAFATEFTESETELYQEFRDDARVLVADGSTVVEREMTATGFSRDAYVRSSLGNDIGIVELTFTWEGFAVVEPDRVVMGDVFEGGLYVGSDQDLEVAAGEGLEFASVDPPATQSDPDSLAKSDTVTWSGEQQFTDRRPRVVFQEASSASGDGTTDGSTPSASDGENPAGDGGWGAPEVAIVLALTVLAILAIVRFGEEGRVRALRERLNQVVTGPVAGRRAGDSGTGGDEAAQGAESSRKPETAENGAGDAASGSTSVRDDSQPAVSNEELLSDEDRIVQLLEAEGGRMKQNRIVNETGWSKSKVSVVLTEMAEAGTLSKLRVGRENVISLEGHEHDATRSPFDADDK